MTSISSSCSSSSSSSSNNSKNTNKSISPLTNFINENYNQQHFSEFSKIEELQKNSLTENHLSNSSSQINQQQLQMLELLKKAGFLTNSLLNKQEDEQNKQIQLNNNEIVGSSSNLFNSNSLLNNLPNSLFVQQQQQKEEDLLEEEEEGEQLIGGQRKKRKLIGNLDNTLDGLVAKRVDMPLKKRYQSETEAIELPDDELEMKRMETDPDVCTRMCSVCGYQGKWVSEMIRHKRVHTDDRPFKCKYCNRTSKWKADLIRHVAKTHGIRVVSKYSRSKAFDFGKNNNNNKSFLPSTEQQLTIDDVIMDLKDNNNNTQILVDNNNNTEQILNASSITTNNKTERMQSPSTNFSDSLNSMFRKAQRLNGLIRNNNNNGKLLSRLNNKQKNGQKQKIKTKNINNNNNSIIQKNSEGTSFNLINLFGANNNKQLINATVREQFQQQLLLSKLAMIQSNQNFDQKQQQNYKCGLCIFQQTSYPLLVSHLFGVHNISPFSCQNCNRSFTQFVSAVEHFSLEKCYPIGIKWNFSVNSGSSDKTIETNSIPLNFFGQNVTSSSNSNNILFPQNIHSNNISNNFGGGFGNFLPPSIFSLGLPTMASFSPNLSGLSIAQLNGISQNCCSPGSSLSTAPSYGSLFNNNCEKQKQTIKTENNNIEDLNEQIKSNSVPELKISAPISIKNNSVPLHHSPLEAETANQQNLNDNEDLFINVDDDINIKEEEEEEEKSSKDEIQNNVKNTSMAALMFFNAVQIQQKLNSKQNDKIDTTSTSNNNESEKEFICPTITENNNNPSLAAFSQFLAELQQRTSTANFN